MTAGTNWGVSKLFSSPDKLCFERDGERSSRPVRGVGEPAQSVATLNRVDMKRFRALMSDTFNMMMNRLKQETKRNETTTAREGEKERKTLLRGKQFFFLTKKYGREPGGRTIYLKRGCWAEGFKKKKVKAGDYYGLGQRLRLNTVLAGLLLLLLFATLSPCQRAKV